MQIVAAAPSVKLTKNTARRREKTLSGSVSRA
jgi:hypothetical protein